MEGGVALSQALPPPGQDGIPWNAAGTGVWNRSPALERGPVALVQEAWDAAIYHSCLNRDPGGIGEGTGQQWRCLGGHVCAPGAVLQLWG